MILKICECMWQGRCSEEFFFYWNCFSSHTPCFHRKGLRLTAISFYAGLRVCQRILFFLVLAFFGLLMLFGNHGLGPCVHVCVVSGSEVFAGQEGGSSGGSAVVSLHGCGCFRSFSFWGGGGSSVHVMVVASLLWGLEMFKHRGQEDLCI
jgi:hypothetical protein